MAKKDYKRSDMVVIEHPKLPDSGTATVRYGAFDAVWEDKGWKIVEKGTEKPSTSASSSSSSESKS